MQAMYMILTVKTGKTTKYLSGAICPDINLGLSTKINGSVSTSIQIISTETASYDTDNSQSVIQTALQINVARINNLPINLQADKANSGLDSTVVTLNQGLINDKNGNIIGADFWLDSDNILRNKIGAILNDEQTIVEGSIIYMETKSDSTISGSYYYSTENSAISHTTLRNKINTDKSKWQSSNGGAYRLRESSGNYLLATSTQGLDLTGASLIGKAKLSVSYEKGSFNFDPKNSVNNVNDTLYLQNLNLQTGTIVTIYNDRSFQETRVANSILSINQVDWQENTNIIRNKQLPTNVNIDSGFVEARLLSDGLKIEDLGKVIYVKKNGNDLEVYADNKGQVKYNKPSSITQLSNPYLMFKTSIRVGSSGIRGIEQGQELKLIALGESKYQVAVDDQEFYSAIPMEIYGNQITNGALSTNIIQESTNQSNIKLTTAIDAKNNSSAGASSGSNPKLRDFASNPLLLLSLASLRLPANSVLGQNFKDGLKTANGNQDVTTSDQGLSIASATNIINHNAITEINGQIRTTSTGHGNVTIDNKIAESFSAYADAATNKDGGSSGNVQAAVIALAYNQISNTSKTIIGVNGSLGSDQSMMGDIAINNLITYPNRFIEGFGSQSKINEWYANPSNAVKSISGLSGVLIQNGFNSFATVKNKSKDYGTKKDKQEGSDLACALAMDFNIIDNSAQTDFAGKAYGNRLSISNGNSIDYTLGAGDIHIDLGVDSLFKIALPNNNKKTEFKEKGASSFKNFVQYGNVAKNGFGAALNIELSSNKAQTTLMRTAQIKLLGSMNTQSWQNGKSVHIITATGSSNNYGVQGGVDITLSTGDQRCNSTGLEVQDGAYLQAQSLTALAADETNHIIINGQCQFTESVGLGLVLTISDIERRTRNTVRANNANSIVIEDTLSLSASNSGSNIIVSAAGTASQNPSVVDQENENKNITGNNALKNLRRKSSNNYNIVTFCCY
jgi:hypothetical protein